MNKVRGKDMYFIHIPKNAGTMFIKMFCENEYGHHRLIEYNKKIWNKTVAIVRNPYDRLISYYKYVKMKKDYWHSNDNTTKYGLNELYEYCNNHTFNEFIEELCTTNKFNNIIHLKPQYYWLETPDNKIISKILYFENLENELNNLFNEKKTYKKINPSTNDTIILDDNIKDKIYKKYKKDFILFNYNK